MDAYLRRLQREVANEPVSGSVARYIAALERSLGISQTPPTYDDIKHLLRTAKNLHNEAINRIIQLAYADVLTPVEEPVLVTWNLPSELTINWYDEYPPYSEVWDFGSPGQEVQGISILSATKDPLKFDIQDPDEPESGILFSVPRWLFRLSDDELPIFESIRKYLPDVYIAKQQAYDVSSLMDGLDTLA